MLSSPKGWLKLAHRRAQRRSMTASGRQHSVQFSSDILILTVGLPTASRYRMKGVEEPLDSIESTAWGPPLGRVGQIITTTVNSDGNAVSGGIDTCMHDPGVNG